MKPFYILMFFSCLLPKSMHSQEFVINGSFEVFSACPTTLGQIGLADGWIVPPDMDISSPDYFNACGGPPVGVPNNLTGSQNAFDGYAYAGIATHSSIENYREYVQTMFSSPLVAGEQYLVSFRVSAAGSGYSNNIGALVSTTQPHGDGTFNAIDAIPQINATYTIENAVGWTEVSGTYVSNGGEMFLTIGNFFDDAATVFSGASPTAYYYVDDVSVTPITIGLSNFDTPDLIICPIPAIDWVNVIFARDDIKTIEVYSAFRKVPAETDAGLINLNHLPAGVYCIVLTTGRGKTITRKIVKK